MEKKLVDRMIDVLVFGQLFVDELEGFQGQRTIFTKQLNVWARKTVREFRNRVDVLFANMPSDKLSVSMMYDINFDLLTKMNKLTIDEKLKLVKEWDSVVSVIKVEEQLKQEVC